jgi:hypothetical protein
MKGNRGRAGGPRGKGAAAGALALAAAGLAAALAVGLAACDMEALVPDAGRGAASGLEVPVTRLTLFEEREGAGGEKSLWPAGMFVAPAGGGDTLQLRAERFPAHNTMAADAVRWTVVGDDGIVSVDQDGLVEVVMPNVPGGQVFAETRVRAYLYESPTRFAELTVRVIPDDWGNNRTFNFGNAATIVGMNTSDPFHFPDTNTSPPFPAPQLPGPTATTWLSGRPGVTTVNDFGDLHLGDGIFLLLGTGGAAPEGAERGSAGLGLDGAGWRHSASFVIDPDDPFRFGITPDGSPRPMPTGNNALHYGHVSNLQNFNDPSAPTAQMTQRHMRTAGEGGRKFMLLGLQAPFEIWVRYRANAGEPRWVDIRFGDTSGIRIEGPVSPGNQTGEGRTVRFRYVDYLYSYGLDGQLEWVLQDGRRIPQDGAIQADLDQRIALDPFVPVTFIEYIGGMQFYEIAVRPLGP